MNLLWTFLLSILLPMPAWPQEATLLEECDCAGEQLGGLSQREDSVSVEETLARRVQQQGEEVLLELFVMSLCPYGMEAERALLPLVERFKDQVELEIYFIADERGQSAQPAARRPASLSREGCAAATASGDGPFASLHGQPEIDEGRRQLIVRRDSPDRFRSYLLCRSRQGAQGDWRECARAAGLDPQALHREAAGPRGEQLFRENIRLANALGINLSPTLLIDGEEFSGDFAPLPLARRLCRSRPGHPLCQGLPACASDADCDAPPGQVALCRDPGTPQARCEYGEPVPFSLQVLNSRACPLCDTGTFLASTLELFPQARVEALDLETPAGEKIARQYGIQVFPAYIFNSAFAREPRFARVQHLLEPRGADFLLAPRLAGASYWPQRPRRPGRLDVFLPAGGQEAEAELLERWSRKNSDLHFHHLEETVALADSLELEQTSASALIENQVLLRRARPEEIMRAFDRGAGP